MKKQKKTNFQSKSKDFHNLKVEVKNVKTFEVKKYAVMKEKLLLAVEAIY